MWRLCSRVMMLIGIICVCALPDHPSTAAKIVQKRQTTHRYCGKNLVDVLKFLCRGQYNGMEYERKKRDVYYSEEDPFEDRDDDFWSQSEDLSGFPNLQYPFRSRPAANTLANMFRRRQKRGDGIVEECCVSKGCTVNELRDYCSPR